MENEKGAASRSAILKSLQDPSTTGFVSPIGRSGGVPGALLKPMRSPILVGSTNVDRLPNAAQALSEELRKLGWFLDLGMYCSDIGKLLKLAKAEDLLSIDRFFVAHFREHIPDLEKRVILRYPNRVAPMRQAFAAAAHGDYFVAIPVLLAQADGISMELFGGKLFKSEKSTPEVYMRLKNRDLPQFAIQYLSALSANGGMNAAEKFRADFPHAPNRHEIMHGIDTTYGTEVNYMKSFSVLSFVALHISKIVEA